MIVGPDGVVTWSYEAPSPGDLPGANLIFDGLAREPAERPPFGTAGPRSPRTTGYAGLRARRW